MRVPQTYNNKSLIHHWAYETQDGELLGAVARYEKAGEHYAQDVYRALVALPSPPDIKILRLPNLPDGGDIIDWLQAQIMEVS